MAFNFLKRIFKPKTTDVLFGKVASTGKARLENQDGCISEFGHA